MSNIKDRADNKTKKAIMESIELGETVENAREPGNKAETLTPEEENFVNRVAEGNTLAKAYELSFDASMLKRASVYQAASRLMDRPRIAARLAELVRDKQEKSLFKDAVYIRQHILDRLLSESVDDKSSASARLKALELLGKTDVVGLFRETEGNAKPERDPEAVAKELDDKLKAYVAKLKAEKK